jgi:hypothetical protein
VLHTCSVSKLGKRAMDNILTIPLRLLRMGGLRARESSFLYPRLRKSARLFRTMLGSRSCSHSPLWSIAERGLAVQRS